MTKNKIDIEKMNYLIYMVHINMVTKGKESPYKNLMDQVETYKIKNTPFDISIHNIDDFMVDAYIVYENVTKFNDEIFQMYESMMGFMKILNISVDELREKYNRFKESFEQVLIQCDFEGVQIKGIQKNFLRDKMDEAVDNENYELAAKLRDKINKII